MRAKLEQVLAYSNPDLTDKISVAANVTEEFAGEIFHEMLKWLWLCAEAKNDRSEGKGVPRLVIDEPLHFIDIGWHEFILFTKEYANFCESNFGFFIHHNPTPIRRKNEIASAIETDGKAMDALLTERRRQYEYVHDKLGAETLVCWYESFGERLEQMTGKAPLPLGTSRNQT